MNPTATNSISLSREAETTVCYDLEGEYSNHPGRWTILRRWPTHEGAIRDEAAFHIGKDSDADEPLPGWSAFRIVRVTTIREIMPP